MLDTGILDVAVGLLFIYLLLSFFCTAAQETLEGWIKRRATALEAGIREMLDDPEGTEWAFQLYSHPLIYGLFPGEYRPRRSWGAFLKSWGRTNLPSYISARNFSSALLDIAVHSRPGAPGRSLKETLEQLPNAHVRRVLLSLASAAGEDMALFRENVETWFNSAMERLSGPYKRFSHGVLLVLGLVLAAGLNVDTVAVLKGLADDPRARQQLAFAAEAYRERQAQTGEEGAEKGGKVGLAGAKEAAAQLRELHDFGVPIGWSRSDPRTKHPEDWEGWVTKIVGWLLTALAISLGAPFWFDLLNRFMSVRSSRKPEEEAKGPGGGGTSGLRSGTQDGGAG